MLALALLLTACSGKFNDVPSDAWHAMTKADRYELLSLDPTRGEVQGESFHGWRVLGTTTITDESVKRKLNDALRASAWQNQGLAAGCFQPRHAIRASRSGKTTDIVICFHCLSATVFAADERQDSFLLSDSAEPTFDRVLKRADVPLAPKSE